MSYVDFLEVVKTDNPERWREVLEEIGSYDYYHLPEFHRLWEKRDGTEAAMPVFRMKGYTMAFPLMLRDIDIPPFIQASEGYRDATSAPGLVGPLLSDWRLPEDVRLGLMRQLTEFLRENRIISVYGRLNFFFNQMELLRGFGRTREMGYEVSVDLTKPLERQFSDYTKGHRQSIAKLKKLDYTVTEAGMDCLDRFLEIYYSTMDRVGAAPVFYYDRPYFEYLLTEIPDMHMFSVNDGDTVTSMGMFCVCNGVIHYLYAGTISEYCSLSPSKLMLDWVREWGNGIGAHTLHLGGSSYDRDDPLLWFKMGFGGREHVYSVWRYVADQDAYDDLCRRVNPGMDKPLDDSYFPEYRNPNLLLKPVKWTSFCCNRKVN
jgi:hypothetical protein